MNQGRVVLHASCPCTPLKEHCFTPRWDQGFQLQIFWASSVTSPPCSFNLLAVTLPRKLLTRGGWWTMANMPRGFPLRPICAPASPRHTHLSVQAYRQGPSGILASLWSRCSLKTHLLSLKLLWCFSLSHVATLPASSSFLPYWPVYSLTWCVTSVSPVSPGGSGGWQCYLFPTWPSPAQPCTEQVLQTALSIQVSSQLYSSRPSLYISFHNAEFKKIFWVHSASLESPLRLDLVSGVT